MNYTSLPNHDNLRMIWKYYPSLVYIRLEKLLRFYHIVLLSYSHPTRTYDFLDENLVYFKEKVWNIGPQIFEKNAIGLFKVVKVDHKIMLINLIPLNVYL
jgi:hypothetical protein